MDDALTLFRKTDRSISLTEAVIESYTDGSLKKSELYFTAAFVGCPISEDIVSKEDLDMALEGIISTVKDKILRASHAFFEFCSKTSEKVGGWMRENVPLANGIMNAAKGVYNFTGRVTSSKVFKTLAIITGIVTALSFGGMQFFNLRVMKGAMGEVGGGAVNAVKSLIQKILSKMPPEIAAVVKDGKITPGAADGIIKTVTAKAEDVGAKAGVGAQWTKPLLEKFSVTLRDVLEKVSKLLGYTASKAESFEKTLSGSSAGLKMTDIAGAGASWITFHTFFGLFIFFVKVFVIKLALWCVRAYRDLAKDYVDHAGRDTPKEA